MADAPPNRLPAAAGLAPNNPPAGAVAGVELAAAVVVAAGLPNSPVDGAGCAGVDEVAPLPKSPVDGAAAGVVEVFPKRPPDVGADVVGVDDAAAGLF